MNSIVSKIHYQKFLLLFIPAVYMFISSAYINSIGGFYMEGPDPVYAYLFNGLNLATGHMEVGHVDHPGTPVQYFVAVVIFFTNLFSGQTSLPEDVMNNPELYLHSCCMALVCILGIVVFFTGLYVYKKTGSFLKAAFFQLPPILFPDGLFHVVLPRPEALFVIAGTFLAGYLLVNLRHVNQVVQDKGVIKKVIVFGIFSAFMVTTKLTCAPFVIGLFIMLKGRKNKFVFLLSVLLSGILFAFPALYKIDNIKHWVINLMTHDGHYGSGNTRFANPETYWKNIAEIFTTDYIFTVTYFLLFVSVVVSLFKYGRKYFNSGSVNIATGLFIAISLLIVAVAKHYSFYYLMPVSCFIPLSIYAAYKCFKEMNIDFLPKSNVIRSLMLFVPVLLLISQRVSGIGYVFEDKYRNPMADTQEEVKSYGSIPLILTSEYESSFVEPSLYFGIVYSGEIRYSYYEYMNKRYSDSYLYRISNKKLLRWDTEYLPYEVIGKYEKMLVYFRNSDVSNEEAVLAELSVFNEDFKLFTYKKVFFNERTKESLYLIESNSSVVESLPIDSSIIFSDLENVSEDKTTFKTSNEKYGLKNSDQLSSDENYSGHNAIKLNREKQYGLDIEFDIENRSYLIDVTVWRKSDDDKGVIVLEGIDKSFYAGDRIIVNSSKDNWKQIRCRFKLPENYNEKKVKLYLYYNGDETAYFDDIEIKVFNIKLKRDSLLLNAQ